MGGQEGGGSEEDGMDVCEGLVWSGGQGVDRGAVKVWAEGQGWQGTWPAFPSL